MSITPKLKCPPDYSVLCFRYVDCKSAGIVKGVKKLAEIDLKQFFLPVTEYSERSFIVKAKGVERVDPGNLADFGLQQETYTFQPGLNTQVADGTTHRISMYDAEDGTLLYTTTYTYSVLAFPDFCAGITDFINNDANLSAKVKCFTVDAINNVFKLQAVEAGKKNLFVFAFDINGDNLAHPGTLLVPAAKWPNGRVKMLFLLCSYDKFTPTNQKNYQWAFDDDYQTKANAKKLNTKIICNADSAFDTFSWSDTFDIDGNLTSFNKRPAYLLSVGDLIRTNANTATAFISEIDGYTIKLTEAGIGDASGGQLIQKVYSPASIQWRTGGENLMLSGGEEVETTDALLMETIWIKNPYDFDIPFQMIIAR